jgi:long-chain acyl-CoA synthetase
VLASFLATLGVKSGQSVAILSATRPEWLEADLAIQSLGAVSVAIYQSLPPPEIAYILHDSESSLVIAENSEQVEKLLSLHQKCWPIPATEERPVSEAKITLRKIISFEEVQSNELLINYKTIFEREFIDQALLESCLSEITREHVASLVYTSGTTGPAKGVIQTHGNHLSNVRQALQAGIFGDSSQLYLFLPLAHSFARLIGYIGLITSASLIFPRIADPKRSSFDARIILSDMRDGEPQIVPAVPRIFEKIADGLRERASHRSLQSRLLKLTINSALKRYRGESSLFNQILYEGLAPIRRKIKLNLFGKRFMHGVSGGAKLSFQVNELFEALGISINEGYGLTETCVATNVNSPGRKKIGTVGPLLAADIEIRIAEDGEVLYRGPNISKGYLNRPIATSQAWDKDGWFHTGDLGSLDNEGFLSITGRKKELIVTAGGKKISPLKIEEELKASLFISNALLFGDDKPYCVALITLDQDSIRSWAKEQQIELTEPLERDKLVKELINKHVEQLNQELSSFESIKKFSILEQDFTIENSLLTPTLKLKRKAVVERYKDKIEGLYS